MVSISDIRKGHYVVAQVTEEDGSRKKPQLLKVMSLSPDTLTVIGRLEKDPHLSDSTIEVKETDLLVDLGKKPQPGKVYGYDLAKLFRTTKEHDAFGDVHFFTTPDEKNLASFWRGLDRSALCFKKNGLSFLVSKANFVLEVVPKHGKYAGMYIHSGNPEKKLPRIQLSVGDDTLATASVSSYTYVVLHEFAHMLDFQFLSEYPEINSSWLTVYATSIGPRTVSKERTQELLKALVKSGESLKGFYADLDEDGRSDFKLIIKWIREIKNVTPNDLSTLLTSRSDAALAVLDATWPSSIVRSKKLQPIVTEYACKSRRELFAESVSLYLLGKELPSKVRSLVEKSLSQARGFAKGLD